MQWFHRHFVAIYVVLALWWLSMFIIYVGTSHSADYIVTLTPAQETALLYATEQTNERSGLPAATAAEVLTQRITADLENLLRSLDAVLDPVIENLKALDAETLAKVLATVQSQSTKDRIQQRLAP